LSDLQRLKDELELNGDLAELLEVLKGIAVAEFRVLESRRERFEQFTEAFRGFFRMIDLVDANHSFVRKGTGKKAVAVVTSDEGFMGGLNSRLLQAGQAVAAEGEAEMIIFGERALDELKADKAQVKSLPSVNNADLFESAVRLKDVFVQGALAGEYGEAFVVYPQPVSFMVQKIETVRLLPCAEIGIRPKLGEDVIVESAPEKLVEYLVSAWLDRKLYEILEDSRLAVMAVRTVRLEQSVQTVTESGEKLRFKYFRARREMVDKGMRESFSAQIIRNRQAGARAGESA
jgi:ATP synthase F1 gamma subunit